MEKVGEFNNSLPIFAEIFGIDNESARGGCVIWQAIIDNALRFEYSVFSIKFIYMLEVETLLINI